MTANIQDKILFVGRDQRRHERHRGDESVADWSRQLIIRSERHEDDHVLVAMQETGVGIDLSGLAPPNRSPSAS